VQFGTNYNDNDGNTILQMWYNKGVTSASALTFVYTGSGLTTTAVALAAYSNAWALLTGGLVSANGTADPETIRLTTTVINSFVIAGFTSDYGFTPTSSTGNLRAATSSAGGLGAGIGVALIDNTRATLGSATCAAGLGSHGQGWGGEIVELTSGGFGTITNSAVSGSDAAFSVQFESGTVVSPVGSPSQVLFTVTLANGYSGSGAGVWAASCEYIGTGTTPGVGGPAGMGGFYCVVTGTNTFNVCCTGTFTPAASTYYNFLFNTYGLSATS
jgi:hypothetical protein